MRNYLIYIMLIMSACSTKWEDHYETFPETVNQNVWEAIQADGELSEFVSLIKLYKLDTLFNSDNPITLFIPNNNAISQFLAADSIGISLLNYHLSSHFIQSGSIQGVEKIQTFEGKFALFQRIGNAISFDGIPVLRESPLYYNGKYFIIGSVAKPNLNLYEFFSLNNSIFKAYIDSKDSIILDKEKSKPIDFDENGNTVYDSVSFIYNSFEGDFFPIKQDFRTKAATIVFPLKEDYESALTAMAQKLGGGYTDYSDIPIGWQRNILVPHLLVHGLFQNMLEPTAFAGSGINPRFKMKNILGDSVLVTYKPVEKTICSNGYAYNYEQFVVPDSLYLGKPVYEAEWMLDKVGNKYLWNENVTVISDQSFEPNKVFLSTASNDSISWLTFPKKYSGNFSVEFSTQSVFPRRYVMVVGTHMDYGGIYDIYVNDVLVKTFDYYDYVRFRGLLPSVITGTRFIPVGRFNKFDFFVENLQEYGPVKIRFVYKAPGNAPNQGLVLDNIAFNPAP